jgi:hypothetical protein
VKNAENIGIYTPKTQISYVQSVIINYIKVQTEYVLYVGIINHHIKKQRMVQFVAVAIQKCIFNQKENATCAVI